jgi:N-formylglutamate amidohydrolase
VTDPRWQFERGDDCIITTAIHAGHELRPDVRAAMKLADADRLREEDPFTDAWTHCAKNSVVVNTSRFEMDLNRPRETAVYRQPSDAWGLEVWHTEPSDEIVAASLAAYDQFYEELGALCDQVLESHGRFVLLDLHSYNHRRGGPNGAVDDPELNPEINLGTESIDRAAWGDVVDVFAAALARIPYDDDSLDIRENVKFKGGAMTRWINARYGDRGCSIAVEMKKIFMNEWTGIPEEGAIESFAGIISSAADEVRNVLNPTEAAPAA